MNRRQTDLVGYQCGRLTVISKGYSAPSQLFWKCRCQCGNIRFYTRQQLMKGTLLSCGCFKSECKGNSHKNWRGIGILPSSFVCKIKAHAKRRKIKFELNKEYLWSVFSNQKEMCALTGLKLTFPTSHNEMKRGVGNASLDRIDSSKGYVEKNVQWVHKDINMMKQQLSTTRFVNMCNLVSKHNE